MPYFFCIFASSNPIKMKQLCINYKKCDSIEADICLPASKSIANRALVVASLGDFVELLDNLSDCDDTHAVINALSSKTTTPNIGAAGTAMRFLTAYYAQKAGEWQLSGSERMHQRPIGILVEALRLLGSFVAQLVQIRMTRCSLPTQSMEINAYFSASFSRMLTGRIGKSWLVVLSTWKE